MFKKIFYWIVILSWMSACSEINSNLDQLGTENSFTDVEIEDEFDMSEDTDVDLDVPGPITLEKVDTFSLEEQIFQLAHGSALRWDGCDTDKATQGGYNSDSQCGRAFFHPSFAKNLNNTFHICIDVAAKEAGWPSPRRVFIRHLGSYNDRNARNSSRLSHHAYARAWDIVNFNLFDEEGNHYKASTLLRDYKNEQATFYDSFRSCWQDSMPESCEVGDSEYKGSVGHQASVLGGNSLHNDHLHLTFPLCAGNI